MRRTFSSLRYRNYRLFFFGQAISQSGSWMQRIALAWFVLQLTHGNSFAVGIMAVAQFLPFTLFGLFAGVITDRMDAVFNWGVGLEHRFGGTLSGFASYHTDLSGRKRGEAPSASITAWDLHDVAAGVTWHVLRSDFALGVTTAFGSQPTPAVPNPPEGAPTPQDLQTHEMLVTVSLGWKITY